MVAAALDDDVSSAGIQLLAGLGGVLAGAVAGYLGASVWGRARLTDDDKGTEP